MISLLNFSFSLLLSAAALLHNSSFCLFTLKVRLYSMLRSLFFWDKNTDAARRDQHQETGSALCAIEGNLLNALSSSRYVLADDKKSQ
jgi:hypothetical protein